VSQQPPGPGSAPGTPPPPQFRKRWDPPGVRQGPLPESVAWGAVQTMLSGLLGFGVPGYLLDRWLGTDWIVLPGLLLGMAVALTVVWFRYGTDRSGIQGRD
jgi:hypothetical protein